MYNDVITLISESKTIDEYGDIVTTKVERTVFCEVASVGGNEFYQASSVGIRPEIKFIIPDVLEYKNEKFLKYKPYGYDDAETYTVIRTFSENNMIELTCKKGVE